MAVDRKQDMIYTSSYDTTHVARHEKLDYWVGNIIRPLLLSKSTLLSNPGAISFEVDSSDFDGAANGFASDGFTWFEQHTSPIAATVAYTDNDRVTRMPYALVVNSSTSDRYSVLAQEQRRSVLPPGSIGLLDYRHAFQLSCDGGGSDRIYLSVSEAAIRGYVDDAPNLVGIGTRPEAGWGAVLARYLMSLSWRDFVAIGDYPAGLRLIHDHALVLFSYAIRDAVGKDQEPPHGPAHARRVQLLAAIRGWLQERLSDPGLTSNDVALAFDISPRTLSRLYLRHGAGHTFLGDLHAMRVDKATHLLAHSHLPGLSVAEIGMHCGFGDTSSFIRIFRQHTGMTPGHYRRLHVSG